MEIRIQLLQYVLCYKTRMSHNMKRGAEFCSRLQVSPAKTDQADQSLCCPPEDALNPWLPTVPCKNSDQTARMRSLI